MTQHSNSSVQPHFDGHRYFNPFATFQSRSKWATLKWLVWDHTIAKKRTAAMEHPDFEMGHNDAQWLAQNRQQFSLTWIGHSTLLIQMQGVNILTDPIFSERASPLSFVGPKRIMPPGLPFKALPPIDLVLISHDHYDHLDKNTILRLGNNPFYIVPLGVGKILRSWGITHYVEADWGDEIKFDKMEIICAPAQHFSGRTPFGQNTTLWAGWILKGASQTFYFAGDTGYFRGFSEIAQAYGPIDFAALPIGAYAPRWFMRPVHLDPEEALQAFKDLRANIFVPIHWGTFNLADELPQEPVKILQRKARMLGLDDRIWLFKHGETKTQ